MDPQQPSISSEDASKASATLANDEAKVPASNSGEPDPAPVPVPVPQQQEQLERQVVFYCPATLQQCQQLFGATCRVQLHRCQIADAPAAENSASSVDGSSSASEASSYSRDASKVKEEEDTSFCEKVPSSGSAHLKGARKLVEHSNSESDSNDENIKVFPYSPAAASTKKRPVSAPAASQVKWEDSSDPEESGEELKFFPASLAVRKKKTGKGVSQESSKSTFSCTVCKKTLSSKSYLKAHMAKHTGEKRYKCQKCGRSFLYRTNLSNHIKRRDQRNGVCPQEKKINAFGSWRPKGSWTCEICGKKMKAPKNFLNHMRAHRGEKTFKCAECGKGFVTNGDLSLHSRIHTQDWQYTCVFCGKGFRQQPNYWTHLRVHTEEKPYFCVVEGCGASFRQRATFKKHRRMLHLKKY